MFFCYECKRVRLWAIYISFGRREAIVSLGVSVGAEVLNFEFSGKIFFNVAHSCFVTCIVLYLPKKGRNILKKDTKIRKLLYLKSVFGIFLFEMKKLICGQ